MITRRDFTKVGISAAAFAAGAQVITSASNNKNDVATVIPPKEWTGTRRVGTRPNGIYWGGGAELIDVLSGNLNYSLPLITAGGRGVNVRILCSYNSQLWERDNPKVLSYGMDTGCGYGWRVQLGSIIPQYSGKNIVGYLFVSDTGAEFPLTLSQGVWVSLHGLFVSYDPSKRKLQFPDGTFWVMGCESAFGEADAGAFYPTVIEDRNGNQIIIRYMSGVGAQKGNTSSRILEIQDSRAVDTDTGRKSYSFTYDNGVVPHLLSMESHIGKDENYRFSYEVQRVSSPFGGNGNKDYEFVHVLKTVQTEGHSPQTFEYNPFGELHQAQLPYGARYRWEYETVNNQGKIRSVCQRGLILSAGKEEGIWEFSAKQNNGKNARHVTTLTEPKGGAKRVWSFDADDQSESCGLLIILEEKGNGKTLRLTTHLWKYTTAGVPYIGTIVTALDPGTAEETTSKEDFDRDIFGNLTENRKYDYGNPFQPIRIIQNTYLTDPAYIDRGIYDLLVTSKIGDGKESVEQIRNQYDTTPLVDIQNITEHDPGYGANHTIRGNLTESVVGDVYSRIKYDITGVIDSFEDGVGSRVDFSDDKQEISRKFKELIPDNNALSGTQTMLHLNFKPQVIMPYSGKTGFKTDGMLLLEGDSLFTVAQVANTIKKTRTDGTYTLSAFDDFQRLCWIKEGGKDGEESIIKYEWEHAPNATLGLCARASLPHAPNAEPQWVTYEYDGLGRLVSKDMLSHGGKESFVYKGDSATAVNARDGWRKLSIDPIGKLRKVTVCNSDEGSITETNYQYNHIGRLKTATLPRKEGTQQHTFIYDNAGRMVIGNRAESGHEEHIYNADGTRTSRTDAKGQRTAYSYDSQKRLTSIKRFGADGQIKPEQCVTYYYDINPFEAFYSQNSEGKMTAAQWGDENTLPGLITEMYSYSPYGLLKAKRLRINRGGASVDIDLNYTYTTEWRISEISYTGGQPLSYEYDSMGRPSSLISGTDVLVKDAVYTSAGLLSSFQQLVPGTGEYITETRTIGSTCQTHRIVAEQSGNPLLDIEYEYSRKDGRLVADNDRLSRERTTYSYDSMGRLKTAKSADKDWEADYEYDGFGSLTTKKHKSGRGRSFTAKHNSKTNRVQLNQIEYDANGNIINHFGTKLTFDIENRLIEVRNMGKGVEKYAYNPGNLRIWKKAPDGAEEFCLYGADNRPIATYRLIEDGKGNISLSLVDNNIYFAKRLMRSRDEAVVLDSVGNVKAGNNRNTNRRMRYTPFGEEETATVENRIKFGTYLRDEISGLDYAKRRYYSSELGRFISPDPYIGSIRMDNPDSWNRYAYCENDPINNIDPNGTYCLKGYVENCGQYNCPAYVSWSGEHGSIPWWVGFCSDIDYGFYYGGVPPTPPPTPPPPTPLTPNAIAHLNRAIYEVTKYVNGKLLPEEQHFTEAEVMNWVSSVYFSGGNLNVELDWDKVPPKFRALISIEHREPGMYSLHLHSDGHFHVDTFSGAWSQFPITILHWIVDGAGGTLIFDTRGLPCWGCN